MTRALPVLLALLASLALAQAPDPIDPLTWALASDTNGIMRDCPAFNPTPPAVRCFVLDSSQRTARSLLSLALDDAGVQYAGPWYEDDSLGFTAYYRTFRIESESDRYAVFIYDDEEFGGEAFRALTAVFRLPEE